MKTKQILLLLIALLIASMPRAEAQETNKVFRIGYFTGTSISVNAAGTKAFLQGLRDAGYVEGKNIIIDWRSWEGKQDQQRRFAKELVEQNVDVIVAVGPGDTRVAKETTSTIPIVMVTADNPVANGLVASLARPGGNVTGMANPRSEASSKQLQILKEILPKLSQVAAFVTLGPDVVHIYKAVEAAAAPLGVKTQRIEIKDLKDIEAAFQTAVKEQVGGVVMLVSGPLLNPNRATVAALAAKYRMPTTYSTADEVEAGGLLSYAVNRQHLYGGAAGFVVKILKGAKPADLPVEQASKFDLAINLKAAQQIGLTLPDALIKRADKVIK